MRKALNNTSAIIMPDPSIPKVTFIGRLIKGNKIINAIIIPSVIKVIPFLRVYPDQIKPPMVVYHNNKR
jgi:hypothetical protein